ncbi:MAG: hypothetical protein GY756_12830 [bacterium]|nr:hypothetical protein [bacterium]
MPFYVIGSKILRLNMFNGMLDGILNYQLMQFLSIFINIIPSIILIASGILLLKIPDLPKKWGTIIIGTQCLRILSTATSFLMFRFFALDSIAIYCYNFISIISSIAFAVTILKLIQYLKTNWSNIVKSPNTQDVD